VHIPSYTYEQEWKKHYSLSPPSGNSLDEEDNARRKLDPDAPGVRTTRLPEGEATGGARKAEQDGWRLLEEEELSTELCNLADGVLHPVNDLLVETSYFGVVSTDAEGVDTMGRVWPRERFAPQLRAQDADVGDVIDCKDTCDQWIEAKILAVRLDAFFVHYVGWKVNFTPR
jgi:hypothetical protein